MNGDASWQTKFILEIDAARQARQAGNEGRARVCARRAVGIAIREYLIKTGADFSSPSSLEAIQVFCSLPDLPKKWINIAEHFLQHIKPDNTLPSDADLIEEAIDFRQDLLGN